MEEEMDTAMLYWDFIEVMWNGRENGNYYFIGIK